MANIDTLQGVRTTAGLGLGLALLLGASGAHGMTFEQACAAVGDKVCSSRNLAALAAEGKPVDWSWFRDSVRNTPEGQNVTDWTAIQAGFTAKAREADLIKRVLETRDEAAAAQLFRAGCPGGPQDCNKLGASVMDQWRTNRAAGTYTARFPDARRNTILGVHQQITARNTAADAEARIRQVGTGAIDSVRAVPADQRAARIDEICQAQGPARYNACRQALRDEFGVTGPTPRVEPKDPNLARGADLVANAANAPGTTVWEGLDTNKDHKVLPAEVRSTLGDELTSRLGQQAADKTLTTEMTVTCTDRSKGCAKNDPFGSSMIQARDSMGLPKGEIYGDGGLVKYWQDATKLGGVEQDPRKIAGNKVQAPSREALVAAILADPKAPKVYAEWAKAEKKKMDEERAAREKQTPGTESDPTKPKKKKVEGEGDTNVASDQTGTSDQQLAADAKPKEDTGTGTDTGVVAANTQDPPATSQMAQNTAAPVSGTAMAYRPDA